MTTVNNIISQASVLLNDETQSRWSADELAGWVNEGIKQIVILLPEANAVTVEVQLAEGTKQAIPADGVRLVDVLRNTGADGGKPSAPIRIVERDVLGTMRPNWHRDRASTTAKNFVFDERNPKVFYVYPPSRGQHIELVYSQMPAPLAVADELGIYEIYSAALINYALYRAFAKDTEEGSDARSRGYERSFFNAIGLHDKADMKAQPQHHAPPRNKSTGETY